MQNIIKPQGKALHFDDSTRKGNYCDGIAVTQTLNSTRIDFFQDDPTLTQETEENIIENAWVVSRVYIPHSAMDGILGLLNSSWEDWKVKIKEAETKSAQ